MVSRLARVDQIPERQYVPLPKLDATKGESSVEKTTEQVPLEVPNAGRTTSDDRARLIDQALNSLPPGLRKVAEHTGLGAALAQLESGEALHPANAAALLFGVNAADLTKGDILALRKQVLSKLPPEMKKLNKTKEARRAQPSVDDVVRLMIGGTASSDPKYLPVVSSTHDATRALEDLERSREKLVADLGGQNKNEWVQNDPFFAQVKETQTAELAEIDAKLNQQREIVEGFRAWPRERFAEQIERFQKEGKAVDAENAAELLYGLQRLDMKPTECAAVAEALLDGKGDAESIRSPEALFGLMTGVDAATTPRELDAQIAAARKAGDDAKVRTLTTIREKIANQAVDMLANRIAQLSKTGRGVEPSHAAVLLRALERMDIWPPDPTTIAMASQHGAMLPAEMLESKEALTRLKQALIDNPPKSKLPPDELKTAIQRADTPEAMVKIFTGETLGGRAALPLSRRKLTSLVSKTQGIRGEATKLRVRLLDGRKPEQLSEKERETLTKLDKRIASTSNRLDELKAARAGVNAVEGGRWHDQMEVDVLTGFAKGIPGVISMSVMAGVSVNKADADTGWREVGIAGYAMPAANIGGYLKGDVSYTRSEGLKTSGGGGADFLGVWGGPGGDSWGTKFAGGLWLPQIINLGVGHGVDRDTGDDYGALILSTFWPPFSAASQRIDTVIRHPGLSEVAEKGGEMMDAIMQTAPLRGGRWLMSKCTDLLGACALPVLEGISKGYGFAKLETQLELASRGIDDEQHRQQFIDAARVIKRPSDEAIEAAGDDPAKLLEAHAAEISAVIDDLREIHEAHPSHVASGMMLSTALDAAGKGDEAIATAKNTLDATELPSNSVKRKATREGFVRIALKHGDYEAAWPALKEWLGEGDSLKSKLAMVQWLGGQGRAQEAKQLAEGLVHDYRFSYEAKRSLAAVTDASPVAEVPT